MPDRADLVATYIRAKDGNRPWLMERVFARDARLEMSVRTDAIDFPSAASGSREITEILVRRFARENENVYTFCLVAPPEGLEDRFACDWLVGMSRRETGEVRVGCGRYDWTFRADPEPKVALLAITIRKMAVLPEGHLPDVMRWLCGLAYPWCPPDDAARSVPPLPGLAEIAADLSGGAAPGAHEH